MYDKRKKQAKKAFTIAMGTVLFLGSALAGRQTVMAETVQGYNTAKAVAYFTRLNYMLK